MFVRTNVSIVDLDLALAGEHAEVARIRRCAGRMGGPPARKVRRSRPMAATR